MRSSETRFGFWIRDRLEGDLPSLKLRSAPRYIHVDQPRPIFRVYGSVPPVQWGIVPAFSSSTVIRLICLLSIIGLCSAGCQSTDAKNSHAQPQAAAAANERATTPVTPIEAPSSPEIRPVDMAPQGSKPIAFQRVILTMQTGTEIGKVTGGWLHLPQSTLRASPGEGSKQFGYLAREELSKAHYTIPGGDNQLFGQDESAKARYQLGAEIPEIHLDMHVQPGWSSATINSSGSMTVSWQLYDTLMQKVVFKKTTITPFSKSGKFDEGDLGYFEMFRKSLRQLLAQADFVDFMRPDTQTARTEKESSETSIDILVGRPAEVFELPGSFPSVLDSFVAVEPGVTLGSGFLISVDGYVVTAAHVVFGLKTVPVRLHGGVVLEATVVRLNENADVALLKLPGSSYRPLNVVGEMSSASIGADVYAIGNPAAKELNASVSRGVVSGIREIAGRKFIQTDAAANPGSSGGPLLAKNGRVLGVISWKFAGPEYQGLAFVVPIREALNLMHVKLTE